LERAIFTEAADARQRVPKFSAVVAFRVLIEFCQRWRHHENPEAAARSAISAELYQRVVVLCDSA